MFIVKYLILVFVTAHHSWIFRNLSISFFHGHHQELNAFVNSSVVIVLEFIAQIPGPFLMSFNLADTK